MKQVSVLLTARFLVDVPNHQDTKEGIEAEAKIALVHTLMPDTQIGEHGVISKGINSFDLLVIRRDPEEVGSGTN
jgi:hypothetical protein